MGTDGKASEAAVEALAHMLSERSLIKCDGTGSLHAQHLFFVVNQNRLRYGDDGLEKILTADKGEEAKDLRDLIGKTYPENRRHFHTVPADIKADFVEKWEALHEAIQESLTPLKMGKLWMTGAQTVQMLRQVEKELRKHGKVSLPSLHRNVILDSWLKPTMGQVLSSRMDKLLEGFTEEELATQRVGSVSGDCKECGQVAAVGWLDPDIEDIFAQGAEVRILQWLPPMASGPSRAGDQDVALLGLLNAAGHRHRLTGNAGTQVVATFV